MLHAELIIILNISLQPFIYTILKQLNFLYIKQIYVLKCNNNQNPNSQNKRDQVSR